MKLKEGSVYRNTRTGCVLLCVDAKRLTMKRIVSPRIGTAPVGRLFQLSAVFKSLKLIGNNYQERAICKSS